MNRAIKFRAWQKYHKKMVEVTNISFDDNGEINGVATFVENQAPQRISYMGDLFGRFFLKDERGMVLEIMQYTGLKDKNGVDIYEGDIVSWTDEKDIWSIDFGEFGVPNFELEGYQDLAFGFYLKPQHDLKEVEPFNMTVPLNTTYMREISVIGNIYENTELLEVES